jgi:hypothetical protein
MARHALVIGTLMLAEACDAGWRRPQELSPDSLSPRQQVQVWRQGRTVQWHAVVISADSISGIPYYKPVDCDSCRVAFPRASVDSIRLGDPVAGFWKSVGLVMGVMLAFCAAKCPRDMQ